MSEKDQSKVKEAGFFKRKGTAVKEDLSSTVNYKEINETAINIKEMASHVLSPKHKIDNARKERFEDAVRRQGVTDLDLVKNYKNFVLCFYISLLFCLGCLSYIIYILITGFNFLNLIAILAIFLFTLANAFKFSFRSFQIKHRKLCSVKDWFGKKDFFPTINID